MRSPPLRYDSEDAICNAAELAECGGRIFDVLENVTCDDRAKELIRVGQGVDVAVTWLPDPVDTSTGRVDVAVDIAP